MFSKNALPKYGSGHPITAKDLNDLRDELNRLGGIKGSNPIQVVNDATGVSDWPRCIESNLLDSNKR